MKCSSKGFFSASTGHHTSKSNQKYSMNTWSSIIALFALPVVNFCCNKNDYKTNHKTVYN